MYCNGQHARPGAVSIPIPRTSTRRCEAKVEKTHQTDVADLVRELMKELEHPKSSVNLDIDIQVQRTDNVVIHQWLVDRWNAALGLAAL